MYFDPALRGRIYIDGFLVRECRSLSVGVSLYGHAVNRDRCHEEEEEDVLREVWQLWIQAALASPARLTQLYKLLQDHPAERDHSSYKLTTPQFVECIAAKFREQHPGMFPSDGTPEQDMLITWALGAKPHTVRSQRLLHILNISSAFGDISGRAKVAQLELQTAPVYVLPARYSELMALFKISLGGAARPVVKHARDGVVCARVHLLPAPDRVLLLSSALFTGSQDDIEESIARAATEFLKIDTCTFHRRFYKTSHHAETSLLRSQLEQLKAELSAAGLRDPTLAAAPATLPSASAMSPSAPAMSPSAPAPEAAAAALPAPVSEHSVAAAAAAALTPAATYPHTTLLLPRAATATSPEESRKRQLCLSPSMDTSKKRATAAHGATAAAGT